MEGTVAKGVGDDASSASSAESKQAPKPRKAARTRILRIRRRHLILQHMIDALHVGKTMLELESVSAPTRVRYAEALRQLMALVPCLDPHKEGALDGSLCDYFQDSFLKGELCNRGETMMAAIMFTYPQYLKGGLTKLPRAWRALKGWKRLVPPRSRRPIPRATWCAVASRLVARREYDMAVWVLIAVSSYCRPPELLQLRRRHLVPPARGITVSWSLLVEDFEANKPTKTGIFDASVILDHPFLQFLGPTFAKLVSGDPDSCNFTYPEFTLKLKTVACELGVQVVPYQTRHSGASMDRLANFRTLDEVMKRGHWASTQSLNRYDKAARFASIWADYSAVQQRYFETCERHLEDVMLGKQAAPALPLMFATTSAHQA